MVLRKESRYLTNSQLPVSFIALTSFLLSANDVLIATSSPRDFQWPLYTVAVPPSLIGSPNSRSEISISVAAAAITQAIT